MSAPEPAAQDFVTAARKPTGESLASVCVLIPAWQPGPALLSLIGDLSERGFGRLVVVDDGSSTAQNSVFTDIAKFQAVELCRHAVNLGKGRALKTGFGYILLTHPDLLGVVTADADGQHTPNDIEKVARALLSASPRPVLGSRSFAEGIPWRSRVGNTLTRTVFRRLTGVRLIDTQTGLRGLPRALLPELLPLEGDRYEYEMTMLAHLCRSGPTPLEVPIATVYLDNNRGSHFHPVWDSMRIYFVLLRLFAAR